MLVGLSKYVVKCSIYDNLHCAWKYSSPAALHKNSCFRRQNKVWRNNCGFKGRYIWQRLLLPPTVIIATACLLRIRGFFFSLPTLWLTSPLARHKYSISATKVGYSELCNTNTCGTYWPKRFCDSFPQNRWSLHLSSCLVVVCPQYVATMAAWVFNGSLKCLLFLCCLIIILCVSSVNGWWWLCKCFIGEQHG